MAASVGAVYGGAVRGLDTMAGGRTKAPGAPGGGEIAPAAEGADAGREGGLRAEAPARTAADDPLGEPLLDLARRLDRAIAETVRRKTN